MLIAFAVTVIDVLWLFQSHAAVVKRYNAFCVKRTTNSDTEQSNVSKSTFSVCINEYFHFHINWIVERMYGDKTRAIRFTR